MDKEIYPQHVDFNYKIRCSQHNLKPYVYCEMCMVRSDLQVIKDDIRRESMNILGQSSLAINVIHGVLEKHRKQIEELQIAVELLRKPVK
jgi:hypothetical protein